MEYEGSAPTTPATLPRTDLRQRGPYGTESQLLPGGYSRAPPKEPRVLVPPKCTRVPARLPPCPGTDIGICWFEKVAEQDGSSVKVAGWVFPIWEQPELLATPGGHLSRRGPEFQRELQCAENDNVYWKAVNFYFLPKQSQGR